MLSLGSFEKDIQCSANIRNKLGLMIRINRQRNFLAVCQKQRLRRFLTEILGSSPYYSGPEYQTIIRSPQPEESFRRLPLLEKTRLQRFSEDFLSRSKRKPLFRVQTTGTTGNPMKMCFDHEYYISYGAYIRYFFKTNKLKPIPFSVSLMTVSYFKHLPDYRVFQPFLNNSYCHRINIHPSFYPDPAEAAKTISEEAPTVLRGMPSSLDILMEYLDRYPPSRPLRPRALISMAETLLPGQRQRFEDAFKASVFDEYGLTEVGGAVGVECSAHKGFHINCLDYYVEVVDPSGAPLGDGQEGEIVITNLYHRLVPLVRYRTGDYAILTRRRCPCGAVTPRILKLKGRAPCRFSRPGGVFYHPFDVFGTYLTKLPISQFQMVQEKDHRITLRYKGDHDISKHPLVLALKKRVDQLSQKPDIFTLQRVGDFCFKEKFQAFLRIP